MYTPCTKSSRTGLLINNNTNVLQHNKFEKKKCKIATTIELDKKSLKRDFLPHVRDRDESKELTDIVIYYLLEFVVI